MTKPKTQLDLGLLTAMVGDLTERLAQADADVALLVRLKEAEATATRIRAELQAAQDKRANALADAAKQERMAMYASFKDVRVDTSDGANALAVSYTITVKRLAYNYGTRENDLVERVYHGFESLEADALGYLIDVRPETIPAVLLSLAPGDPANAMRRYHQAKQRGYLAS